MTDLSGPGDHGAEYRAPPANVPCRLLRRDGTLRTIVGDVRHFEAEVLLERDEHGELRAYVLRGANASELLFREARIHGL